MSDVENEVFTALRTALLSAFPTLNITGIYVNVPASFPHVSIEMTDIRNSDSTQDTTKSLVTFTVNAYSNSQSGRKTECKKIMDVVSDTMYGLNLERMSQIPVPNIEDNTIYRITATFSGIADNDFLYRR